MFYIHHQMWVSCEEQYFPIHQMKPCQEDWQKFVFKEKIVLFQRNLSSILNIKQNEKSTCINKIYTALKGKRRPDGSQY